MTELFINKVNLTIDSISEGCGVGSMDVIEEGINKVAIKHDRRNNKDEIEICINGKVVFRYDSKAKDRMTVNHIQMTEEECENYTKKGD